MPNVSNRPHIRIIGDVHGQIAVRPKRRERNVRDTFPRSPLQVQRETKRNYLELIEPASYSVQLGDLGFDYAPLAGVDPSRHRVIAGNHDNLPNVTPHFLGDFGMHTIPLRTGAFEFFFVRGARSVDIDRRIEGISWWADEELDDSRAAAALERYESRRPGIVISHDCPTEIVPAVATIDGDVVPSRTTRLLQDCLEVHAPKLWLFGHHHRNWSFRHPCGTTFVCVGTLSYFDFDEYGALMFEIPR